jgi:hypothetical protein
MQAFPRAPAAKRHGAGEGMSGAVGEALGAARRGAVGAAEDGVAGLDAVADDVAAAVLGGRRQGVAPAPRDA